MCHGRVGETDKPFVCLFKKIILQGCTFQEISIMGDKISQGSCKDVHMMYDLLNFCVAHGHIYRQLYTLLFGCFSHQH